MQLADDLYFYATPPVSEKIRQLVQLFAGLELDPKQLTVHLERRGGEGVFKSSSDANDAKLYESEHFDYCLDAGEEDLRGTKPVGFELNGAH